MTRVFSAVLIGLLLGASAFADDARTARQVLIDQGSGSNAGLNGRLMCSGFVFAATYGTDYTAAAAEQFERINASIRKNKELQAHIEADAAAGGFANCFKRKQDEVDEHLFVGIVGEFMAAAVATEGAARSADSPEAQARERDAKILLASFVANGGQPSETFAALGASSALTPLPEADPAIFANPIPAMTLVGEFWSNELRFDRNNLGKILVTTGQVDSIAEFSNDQIRVRLLGTDRPPNDRLSQDYVTCMIPAGSRSQDKAIDLNVGGTATLAGLYSGPQFGDIGVHLENCEIQ